MSLKVIVLGPGQIGLSGVVPELLRGRHTVVTVSRADVVVEGVRHIKADVYSETMERLSREFDPDIVINMVCFNREQAKSTIQMFPNARQMVFASTVCVYGGPREGEFTAETDRISPITEYGINKYLAEQEFLAHSKIPTTIFRLASAVSPTFPVLRQTFIENNSAWLGRIMLERPVVLADRGEQMWSWSSTRDIGIFFSRCLGNEKSFWKTYNLTNNSPVSWLEYSQRIAGLLRKDFNPVFVPSDAILAGPLPARLLAEQSRWSQLYNTDRLYEDLGDHQEFCSFDETFGECINHWKKTYGPTLTESDFQEEDRFIQIFERYYQ